MNKKSTNEWFEMAKKTPTELSREEVNAIIQILPTLPPPVNPWFKFFNFNSIIMTTLGIAILTSMWIFVSQPNSEIARMNDDIFSSHSSINQESVEPYNLEKDPLSDKLSASINENSKELKEDEANVLSPSAEEIHVGEISSNRPSSPAANSSPNLYPSGKIDMGNQASDADSEGDNSKDVQLKKLKRTLIRELAKDNLIANKDELMILKFMEGEISVNNQVLSASNRAKYQSLLKEYHVEPGLTKRIVIDPKFIMVGDFTAQGFKGSAVGKDMEIVFQKDDERYKGLFSQAEDPYKDLFSVFDAKGENTGTDIFVKTEGDLDDAATLLAGAQRMTATNRSFFGISEEDKSDDIFDTGNQAVSILDKNNNQQFVDLSSRRIMQLKRELHKNFLEDKLIPSKDLDIHFKIEPADLQLNKNPFNADFQAKYVNILAKYGIAPNLNFKILMNRDFILVGEFGERNFYGTGRGTFDSQVIRIGIFGPIMAKYEMFGITNVPGISTTEEREIAPFNGLIVDGLALVYYTQGEHKNAQLKVTGMPIVDVITNVKDGILTVTTRGDYSGEFIRVEVGSKNISTIEINGSGELVGQNIIKGENLTISSREAGSAELKVDVQELQINMNGGDLEIRGKAKSRKVSYQRDAERGSLKDGNLTVEDD